jgi:putative DNA methylase
VTTRLIERWLPIAALGIESVRERTPMTPFPAPNRLHVWWARRPLVASRAAILASLLPGDADREKFMHVLGIHGDPVAAKLRIEKATREGKKLGAAAYGYFRAFSYFPSPKEQDWIKSETARIVGGVPNVLDPTAGGGSIPFETIRLGLSSFANDLNPVAALILRGTVEWPQSFENLLLEYFNRIGQEFVTRVRFRLKGIFPEEPKKGTRPDGYLWARTVICPYCDGLIPLSPNWRLSPDGTGVRLLPNEKTKRCRFKIVKEKKEQSAGTLAQGDAQCPYLNCGRIIGQEQVRQQSRDGVMGEQLFAIVYKERVVTKTKTGRTKEKWIRGYRTPRPEDDNAEDIKRLLEKKKIAWEALDILPTEQIGPQHPKYRLDRYGILNWIEVFSPRQLLCHGTSVEVFREMLDQEKVKGLDEATKAAFVYLSFALDKLLNWNSRLSSWNVEAQRLRSTFDRHDFAIKWSFGEMAPLISGLGYEWTTNAIGKCIKELVELTRPDDSKTNKQPSTKKQTNLFNAVSYVPPPVVITCTSGDNLDQIEKGSVDAIIMDPPYYDNVMYAELSDFFYVWLKRTAGYVFPEWFTRKLTDKENEAVANPAKFEGQKGAKDLAGQDYQQRMAAIFAECHRVLKDDGILTLMFTHKATGAWDALTSGLVEAGFIITASWPINTEAEGSLHIKEKAAANSTIFLVCRPRAPRKEEGSVYWEDVEPLVAKAVRTRVKTYQECGISGVDLYLSCFGPALEEFSKHWPLTRGTPRPQAKNKKKKHNTNEELVGPYAVTPEDALNAARREVKAWRMEQLLRTTRKAELNPLTEWFVLAWDAFRAPKFPFDEALRLARVVGLDLDQEIVGNLAEKKGSKLILWDSEKRAAKGALGPADGSRAMIDALHHAAYRVRKNGLEAGREFLEKAGAAKNPAFFTALTAVLEVLPVSSSFTNLQHEKGLVADAANDFESLENLRRLAFSDRVKEPEQLRLWAED